MKIGLIIVMMFSMVSSKFVYGQTLGAFNPKEDRGTYGPRRFPSKSVYIADFTVHYQVYSDRSTTNKGSQMLVRGVMGKAKASLTIGLDIPESTLQKITDEAYAKFVADLQQQGFNVLTANALKNVEYYKNYVLSNNLRMELSCSMPGGVSVHPQNVPFYYKEKGITQSYTKLSAQLNDANVIRVDLYVLFLESNASNKGFGAKVSAETHLCLAAYEHVKSITANDNLTSKIGLTNSKSEKTVLCQSKIEIVAGKNKIGGSPLGSYTGVLKKDLEINGVLDNRKLKSVASSDYDNVGTETTFGRLYTAQNTKTAKVALVSVDADKYEQGVVQALNAFLSHHVSEFKIKFF